MTRLAKAKHPRKPQSTDKVKKEIRQPRVSAIQPPITGDTDMPPVDISCRAATTT